MKRLTRSSSAASSDRLCELNKDIYPPICDNEHLTGDCYCHLCTCGNHKCPGDYKKQVYSTRSHFSSLYKQNYRKHSSTPVKQSPIPEFRPAKYAFEGMTTAKKDYIKQEFLHSESCNLDKFNYKPLKFVAKTSYSSNFGCWKESFLEKQYVMEHPCGKVDSKFLSDSCYRKDFHIYSPQIAQENNEKAKHLKERAQGSRGLISPSSAFMGKSSQKSDYKSFQCLKPVHEIGLDPIFSLGDWKSNFKSTYEDSYANPIFNRPPKKKYAKIK